jgi:hypothetical protein
LGLLYGVSHPANNNAAATSIAAIASTTIAARKTAGVESAAGSVCVTVLFRIMFFTPYYRSPASRSGGALFALP